MNVCSDQDTFNQAYHDAVNYEIKKDLGSKRTQIICLGVYWFFLFWALCLALKIGPKTEQIKHIFLAVVFPPIYIISYYVGKP
jgi:hypothetical protein